jgi:hypothetical protein
MKRTYLLAVAALLLACAGARASGPVAIYAIIDKVVLEPKEGAPERIKIWGAFMLPKGQGYQYLPPARGYMYFTLAKGNEAACRKEWADLKKLAGTGSMVGFGEARGFKGTVRKAKQQLDPVARLEPKRLQQLINDLGNDQFDVREKATKELEKQGEEIHPALRECLKGKLSLEARKRVERLIKTESPDVYVLAFGLTRLAKDSEHPYLVLMQALPEPVAPAPGTVIDAGKVTLRTRNITVKKHPDAKYVFEIENAKGDKEKSEPIAAGDKETKWTPKMQVKAGQKYTWRIKAVDGKWTGPVADVSFKGKSSP